MSDVASSRLPLPLRFAIRELRAGLRGFYVLVLCIALGVMAIAGIGSVGLRAKAAPFSAATCHSR